MEKRHGKRDIRSVTENHHTKRHRKHVLRSFTEKDRHGKRHGNGTYAASWKKRYGKRHLRSVTETANDVGNSFHQLGLESALNSPGVAGQSPGRIWF